jgi:hypothetical protein
MSVDAATAWARGAMRFFMVQHPTRTSVGIAGGFVVATLADLFKPYLGGINVAALTDLRMSLCGVFVTNVPLLFKKRVLPEAIEEEFDGVRLAIAEGKLSAAHQKLLYLKIAQNVIDRSNLSKTLAEEIKDVDDRTTSDRAAGAGRGRNSGSRGGRAAANK